MPFYSLAFVMALACAAFYYKAGEQELGSGLLWGGLSLIVSTAIWLLLHGGVLAIFLAQVGMLIAIAAFRAWRDPD